MIEMQSMVPSPDSEMCWICQDPVTVNTSLKGVPLKTSCNHIFHTNCIHDALSHAPSPLCPYCRTEVSYLEPPIPRRFVILAGTIASAAVTVTGGMGTVVLTIGAVVSQNHSFLFGITAAGSGILTGLGAVACYKLGSKLELLFPTPQSRD